MQDPEIHLNALGVELPCLVHPKRPARIDAEHRVLINHEVFFFADREALDTFQRNPRKWCGLLTDPVTRERFRPKKSSPTTTYAGRLYYFRSPESRATFAGMPDMYKDPTRKMPGM